jgi:hypothetical protein
MVTTTPAKKVTRGNKPICKFLAILMLSDENLPVKILLLFAVYT